MGEDYLDIQYMPHFTYSKLLYKMGQHFLDIQYH